jgi:hypothetical protein
MKAILLRWRLPACALECAGDLGQQLGWGWETLQLVAHPFEGARLKSIFRGTKSTQLKMLLHQLHFVGSQLAIKIIIEPPNGLLTGISIDLGHTTPQQGEDLR